MTQAGVYPVFVNYRNRFVDVTEQLSTMIYVYDALDGLDAQITIALPDSTNTSHFNTIPAPFGTVPDCHLLVGQGIDNLITMSVTQGLVLKILLKLLLMLTISRFAWQLCSSNR